MIKNLGEAEERILGEVYSSSEPLENLEILCDEFGGRLAGSRENRLAAEFILGKYEEYGFEDPHIESFAFPGCEVGSSRLEIIEPVGKKVSCLTLPRTASGGVEAEVVHLKDVESFEEQKNQVDGKVILVTGRELIRPSAEAGAVGVILMHPFPRMGPPTGAVAPLVPSVSVSFEDGSMISRFIRRRGKVRVSVEAEARHFDRESWNVCGEIPGNGDAKEFVMLGGHYDGHEIAQAAFDCGAPCMAALEMGRVLGRVKERMKRSVRVVLFSAEEFGMWGSKDYAKRHADEMKDMRFTYQLDCCAGGGTQVVTTDYWPQLEPFFEKLRDDLNINMPILQSTGPGDSRAFFDLGIPTGSIRDSRPADLPPQLALLTTVRHTIYDTLDKIHLRSLREVVAIGAVSGFRMVNAEEWPRHRTPEEIRELLARRA